MKFFRFLALLSFVTVMFLSCDDNSLGKLREKELELLDNFIKTNNISVKPTSSGLYYIEKIKGTGDTIEAGDQVDILYRTWLIDSTLVDQNIDDKGHFYEPLRFTVTPQGVSASVVEGLNEGIKFMQMGTVAHMIVPSQIGYGQNGYGYVPAFSTLLFEVRVYKVVKASTGN